MPPHELGAKVGRYSFPCIELSSIILRQFHWRTIPPGAAAFSI